jgi:hypothetical protein
MLVRGELPMFHRFEQDAPGRIGRGRSHAVDQAVCFSRMSKTRPSSSISRTVPQLPHV